MFEKIKKIVKFLVPIEYWNARRRARIIERHTKVADFWHPIIEAYYDEKIERYSLKPKKQLETQKVIWQYWGQGLDSDNLPEIIQICFESVDKNKGDYQVIRLTDVTISEYVDLPDFVWEKHDSPQFTRTFFSDLLRLSLLATYGGVWLDATILLTDALPIAYEKLDFFMFQRSNEEKNKKYWENVYAYYYGWESDFKVRMLSSIIFAQQNSVVISSLLDLLLYFWKTRDAVPDYFCFQILFNELIEKQLKNKNCPIVNDCVPHILQTKLNGNYDYISVEEVLKLTSIHKMTYFNDTAMTKLKVILKLN